MPRYYDDDEDRSRRYRQDFLSPEPPSRPRHHIRRHSKEERGERRPNLQHDYHSDNEAYRRQTTKESEKGPKNRHSSRRVPSPPHVGWQHRGRLHSNMKRIPSPPKHRNRVVSTPGVRRKEIGYNSYHGHDDIDFDNHRSLPVRLLPPPVVIKPHPQRKESVAKTHPGKQVPPPDVAWEEREASAPVDPRRVRNRVPSPLGINRRRHSDMQVPSTSRERLYSFPGPETPASLNRETKPHRDSVPSLRPPLAVVSSFPSPDTIKPEDSRSETSRLTKRVSSGDFDKRSGVLDSSLHQSLSRSVSGVLRENVYQYKQLSAFQFRLVRILPKTMSLIKCELVHYSLEDPPSYVAISYAWGDADDKKRIQLDGADIPISASLHGALFALRAKKESVLVWADALSIDQQNVAERTQQVQLMTYIYSRAVSVAIWLGPEADDSNMAMQTLSEVTVQYTDGESMDSLLASELGKAHLSSVVALFEREYWSRLWVVQEVFNAQEINVYCGAASLPWAVCRLASEVFWNHKSLVDFYFPGGHSLTGQRASSTQFTYSQVLAYHGPSGIPDVASFQGLGEESLLEVMRVCRRKSSADPRDKVYGILGLLPEEIRNEFPVDYNLSVKEIYVRVFDYLLCTTERLDVLCEAVHFPLHTSSNLPTWVPDWSHNPETAALGCSCRFSAADSVKAVARVLDDRRRLEMSAIYLDTIHEHGISVGTLCTLADYIMAFIHWRAQLLSNTEDSNSEARQEEFCRTLSLNQLPSEWKSGSWRAACYHVFASLAHERIPRLPLDEELWRYVDASVGVEKKDRRRFLQEHFGSRMMGRCFCITKNGSIGMGSGFMAAGDTVVVPLGCSTPILLRPEGPRGEHRYVGDVYIHDYMEGEAIKQWQSGERELSKFVLH